MESSQWAKIGEKLASTGAMRPESDLDRALAKGREQGGLQLARIVFS
jgi:hypothetical protein